MEPEGLSDLGQAQLLPPKQIDRHGQPMAAMKPCGSFPGPFAEGTTKRVGMKSGFPSDRRDCAMLGYGGQGAPGFFQPDGQILLLGPLRQPACQHSMYIRGLPDGVFRFLHTSIQKATEKIRLAAGILQAPNRMCRIQTVASPGIEGRSGKSHKNLVPAQARARAVMVGHLRKNQDGRPLGEGDLPARGIPVDSTPTGDQNRRVHAVFTKTVPPSSRAVGKNPPKVHSAKGGFPLREGVEPVPAGVL